MLDQYLRTPVISIILHVLRHTPTVQIMLATSRLYIDSCPGRTGTYDHRVWRTGLPVRSAVLKPHAGRLVVGWVTTSESLLLYVFVLFFILFVLIKAVSLATF